MRHDSITGFSVVRDVHLLHGLQEPGADREKMTGYGREKVAGQLRPA